MREMVARVGCMVKVCHECGKRTETWVLVYLSDFDRVPVCLPCAEVMGWLPTGPLSPAPRLRPAS